MSVARIREWEEGGQGGDGRVCGFSSQKTFILHTLILRSDNNIEILPNHT